MKTIALIASYNREIILQDCINQIKPQVDDIVLVGSSEWVDGTQGCNVEKKIAKKNDLIYVDHTNKVLGSKFQSGLNRCRDLKADAVLICGSDDLISNDYIYEVSLNWKRQVEAGWIIYGKRRWNVYNPMVDDLCFMSYKRRSDFVGAGRVIGTNLLHALDWQIFPTEAVGCDLYSWNVMEKHRLTIIDMNFGRVLSVKGDWDMLDSWDQLLSSPELDISHVAVERKQKFLDHYYPLIDFDKYKRKH